MFSNNWDKLRSTQPADVSKPNLECGIGKQCYLENYMNCTNAICDYGQRKVTFVDFE